MTSAEDRVKHISSAEHAGTVFPPSLITRLIREKAGRGIRVSKLAGVYETAVIEHIILSLLELIENNTKPKYKDLEQTNGKKVKQQISTIITRRPLVMELKKSPHLHFLVGDNVIISGSGVSPTIHKSIVKKKKEKASTKNPKLAKKKSKAPLAKATKKTRVEKKK